MADDGNQDADQQARDLAANAAKERAKRLADQLAIQHAEREYDAARQQAAGGVAELNSQVNLIIVGERYETADLKFEFTVEVEPR